MADLYIFQLADRLTGWAWLIVAETQEEASEKVHLFMPEEARQRWVADAEAFEWFRCYGKVVL